MREKDDHNVVDSEEEMHYSEDRDERVKDSGEIFTPSALVQKMLNELDYDWTQCHRSSTKTFLDPTMGSGNFLVELAKRKIHPKNIYGVDLMDDNVATARKRLLEIHLKNGYDTETIEYHHNRNIIQGDALTYDYNFWEVPDIDEEW